MENNEKEKIVFSVPIGIGKTSPANNKPAFKEKKTKSKKQVPAIDLDNPNYVKHNLDKGVTLVLVKDHEEDYSKLKTVQDVIDLDKRKPNVIVGFNPPLYFEFINKGKQCLTSNVDVGDIVTVKAKFKDNKGHIPRVVQSLYFKSLFDMTVIVAVLNDNDFCLANRLEICK